MKHPMSPTDDEILDLVRETSRLAAIALGETEGGALPPDHPIVRDAKRRLARCLVVLEKP